MSIRHYCGEYLVSPVPIHCGMNTCSHNCWYCFANANAKRKRVFNFDSLRREIMAFAQGKPVGKNITRLLLRKGFPVLISNDTDPFAKSNQGIFKQLWDLLWDLDIPVAVQTRGGLGASDVLCNAPRPTMVYVSVTSDQPERLKKGEPNAPGLDERMSLIRGLKAIGHHVIVGINPFVPHWWDAPEKAAENLAAEGIKHVWLGSLHLSNLQTISMPKRIQSEQADDIAYARKKRKDDRPITEAFKSYLVSLGINVFEELASTNGGFWDAYFDLGFPWFPTIEGFTDHLRKAGEDHPAVFDFEYFCGWADWAPGFRSSQFKEYLGIIGQSIRDRGEVQKAHTLRQALEFFWRVQDFSTPLNLDDIFYLADGDDLLTDDAGRLLLVYAPEHKKGEPDRGTDIELKTDGPFEFLLTEP